MYQEVIKTIANSAKKKDEMFLQHPTGYLIHSAMAGIYVGLGIVLILVLGAPLFSTNSPYISLVMGASFGIALSLTIFAGSDLFTGNTMILPMGAASGEISWSKVIKLMIVNYIGNFLGAILLAVIVYHADIFSSSQSSTFLSAIATKKMKMSFGVLFFRGILCNWLVVLSVWCCYKMKTESGKLIMIFWCLLGFIGSGYEHSVANMTLLTLANFAVAGEYITWSGVLHNLIPVTLGNITSGMIFMGGSYWWVSHSIKKKQFEVHKTTTQFLNTREEKTTVS